VSHRPADLKARRDTRRADRGRRHQRKLINDGSVSGVWQGRPTRRRRRAVLRLSAFQPAIVGSASAIQVSPQEEPGLGA
jgi:hypothetical protein